MTRLRYVHWQVDRFYLGYFEDYPEYITQGESIEDLLAHLRDLYVDFSSGELPFIKKVDELVLS
jgi:hypothetical protein